MDFRLWIDGAWQDTQGGKAMTIENPATEDRLALADCETTKHVMVAQSS